MADRPVELLPALPGLGGVYARALVPSFERGPLRIPETTVMVLGIQPDPRRLADYDRVCGFALRNQVPPTWLHVLTFPLHLHLLGGPGSTVRLAGVMHASNRMRLHRPVTATEVLDAAVHIENLRPHRRGAQFDVVSEVRVADELVWDGVSTYLAPGAKVDGVVSTGSTSYGSTGSTSYGSTGSTSYGSTGSTSYGSTGSTPSGSAGSTSDGSSGSTTDSFDQVRPIATWRLPADLGVDYRRVSGDPNPIHTSRLAARAFGFARPIAHGMWTHAHLLAALEPRLPDAYSVDVTFNRPILLPAKVGAWWHRDGDTWTAAVTTPDGAKPYLRATVHP